MAKKKTTPRKAKKTIVIKQEDVLDGEVVDPQSVESEDAPKDTGEYSQEELEKMLTVKQRRFCILYSSSYEVLGNGTRSYAKAYNIDLEKEPEREHGCRSNATRLLTNAVVCSYIQTLLDTILPDAGVDKILSFLAQQMDDYSVKLRAAQELNKVRGRIIDKLSINSDQNPLEDFKTKTKGYARNNKSVGKTRKGRKKKKV